MSNYIDAIFDHGVRRPLGPLALPDQSRVKLTVEAESVDSSPEAEHADFEAELDALVFDGPSLPADFSREDIYADHD